jgi:hypothetical protein
MARILQRALVQALQCSINLASGDLWVLCCMLRPALTFWVLLLVVCRCMHPLEDCSSVLAWMAMHFLNVPLRAVGPKLGFTYKQPSVRMMGSSIILIPSVR